MYKTASLLAHLRYILKYKIESSIFHPLYFLKYTFILFPASSSHWGSLCEFTVLFFCHFQSFIKKNLHPKITHSPVLNYVQVHMYWTHTCIMHILWNTNKKHVHIFKTLNIIASLVLYTESNTQQFSI